MSAWLAIPSRPPALHSRLLPGGFRDAGGPRWSPAPPVHRRARAGERPPPAAKVRVRAHAETRAAPVTVGDERAPGRPSARAGRAGAGCRVPARWVGARGAPPGPSRAGPARRRARGLTPGREGAGQPTSVPPPPRGPAGSFRWGAEDDASRPAEARKAGPGAGSPPPGRASEAAPGAGRALRGWGNRGLLSRGWLRRSAPPHPICAVFRGPPQGRLASRMNPHAPGL